MFDDIAVISRKTPIAYSGSIPVTQGVNLSFDEEVNFELSFRTSVGFTLTLFGDVNEVISIAASDKTKLSTQAFERLDGFYTSLGAAQGALEIMAVLPSGQPFEVMQLVEETEVRFVRTGRPMYLRDIGKLVQSVGTLFKQGGESIEDDDIVYVAGVTFTVLAVAEMERFGGDTFYRLDLVKEKGREPLT